MTTYAELHLHTCFSFLDGASHPGELVDRAVALGYEALAVTDHNGLYGAMEFAQAARDAGIQPITGAEITLEDESHLTLLAETPEGYSNLCKLITHAHHHGEYLQPRLPAEALKEHSRGLILLTGCRESELCKLIDRGRFGEAMQVVRRYQAWFGVESVFVELQQNLVHGDTRRIRRLAHLAGESGAGCVATGDVHYHIRERHRLQDVMVAIRERSTLDGSHQARRPNAEFFLQPQEVMARRFAQFPEALANTGRIAERCRQFDLTRDLQYRFPDYPAGPGETPESILASVTRQALEERYEPGVVATARERLEEELRLVQKHDLSGFFLVYRDIMQLAGEVADEIRGPSAARQAGNLPPGRGRGSSVSSIICYLIGLSHIDPLKYNLGIGRFLNEELASVPDIDLDFPRDIRERLIERIYEVYGHDRAALVCAFPTYRIRSAIRDIGKALGLPQASLDRLAKLSSHISIDELASQFEHVPEIEEDSSPLWGLLVELAKQIKGMPRHVSQHSGGMVISSQPLNEMVPIQPAAMEGRYICHWDKDSCDDARFIKIDFLALGMLSMVEECLELIAAGGKEPVDLSRIDFEDQDVYEMIRKGDTIGTFQIESRAQIQTLLKTQPERLEDLIVQVAIVRPGPIVGGSMSPFVTARRQVREQGFATPEYDHPLLEPILKETYGAILYQDHILEIAMAMAGFGAGQADRLRRSMSRKRSEAAMREFWEQFRDGAAKKGVPEDVTKKVFEKMMGFSTYGFPKSHAAAFAVLAYQSSWLRYHHPAEFYCALYNNQPMGFYAPHVLTNDARRMNVRTLPPDINQSLAVCSVEGRSVRIGLGYVKSAGKEHAELIVAERERNGPYRALTDFVRRVRVPREMAESLIMAGAFDAFGLRRRETLWQFGLFQAEPAPRANMEKPRQLQLAMPVDQDMVELAPMSAWDRMEMEYARIGLSPHYHPLLLLRPHLPEGIVSIRDLEMLPDGTRIRLAGLVVCRQRPMTAKGITFLLLEDEFGLMNVITYPQLAEKQRVLVRSAPLIVVDGRLQKDGVTVNVIAHRFAELDTSRTAAANPETIPIAPDETMDPAVRELLAPRAHNYR